MGSREELVGAPHLQPRERADLNLSPYLEQESTVEAAQDGASTSRTPKEGLWPTELSFLVDRTIKARLPKKSRRVISYCLVGEDEAAARGAVANVKLARSLYADWQVVVYASRLADGSVLEDLASWGAEVRVASALCRDDQLPLLRFAPVGEFGVEACAVRDVEARLDAREAAAVEEWLRSGAALHVMHGAADDARFIRGGKWGARSADPAEAPLPELGGALLEFVNAGGDDDMAFLELYVRPSCDAETAVHHSEHEGSSLPGVAARPFP